MIICIFSISEFRNKSRIMSGHEILGTECVSVTNTPIGTALFL